MSTSVQATVDDVNFCEGPRMRKKLYVESKTYASTAHELCKKVKNARDTLGIHCYTLVQVLLRQKSATHMLDTNLISPYANILDKVFIPQHKLAKTLQCDRAFIKVQCYKGILGKLPFYGHLPIISL